MNALLRVLLAAALITLVFEAIFGEVIINCQKARRNKLQFMASVQIKEKHKCGGFLINPRFVLTAAHCFREGMSVVIGTHNIDKANPNLWQNRYEVKGNHTPKSYKDPKTGDDIMLLELTKAVHLTDDVKIIPMSKKDDRVQPYQKCQVAGWGITEKTQTAVNDLMVTDVSIISFETCRNEWKNVNKNLPPGVMCAGGNEKSGACQGDSGGPLVCSGVAVGIVSFNLNGNCKYPNIPNVYTDIAKHRAWIDNVLKGV
ncbi:mast cell protease 1A-like [Salminus brasiliensis]|uniref:mast cell protease 1A-like n=1 Tax=Salminus brasiliensis TaxID=930266 RepID=UPI003B838FD0